MTPKQREIQRKRRVVASADQIGNVRKACRYYGVARSTFYLWRARYREFGDEGLINLLCFGGYAPCGPGRRTTSGCSRHRGVHIGILELRVPEPSALLVLAAGWGSKRR